MSIREVFRATAILYSIGAVLAALEVVSADSLEKLYGLDRPIHSISDRPIRETFREAEEAFSDSLKTCQLSSTGRLALYGLASVAVSYGATTLDVSRLPQVSPMGVAGVIGTSFFLPFAGLKDGFCHGKNLAETWGISFRPSQKSSSKASSAEAAPH